MYWEWQKVKENKNNWNKDKDGKKLKNLFIIGKVSQLHVKW